MSPDYRNENKGIGDELTTVRGIVIPVDWNEEGNILAVAILGAGEEEHFVEQDKQGKKMLRLVQQEIEVSGTVRKAIQGHKIITVKSYKLKTGDDWKKVRMIHGKTIQLRR